MSNIATKLGLPVVYDCDCKVCSYFSAIGRVITIVHHGKCVSKVNAPPPLRVERDEDEFDHYGA